VATLRPSDPRGEQTNNYEYGHDKPERHCHGDILLACRQRSGDAGKACHRKSGRGQL